MTKFEIGSFIDRLARLGRSGSDIWTDLSDELEKRGYRLQKIDKQEPTEDINDPTRL